MPWSLAAMFRSVPRCFDVNECLAECHPIIDKWGTFYADDTERIERASRGLYAPLPGGASADAEEHIKSIGGDETYAKVFYISAAVGFRSHDLPEPYDGDWETDVARYHAAPLIVSTDGGLGVQLHEGRMESLKN